MIVRFSKCVPTNVIEGILRFAAFSLISLLLRLATSDLSTLWVWAPESGSTKFAWWFTVSCWYPRDGRQRYEAHSSEWMTDPGAHSRWMMGISVARSRLWTQKYRQSLPFLKPNTQGPSMRRPWFLRLLAVLWLGVNISLQHTTPVILPPHCKSWFMRVLDRTLCSFRPLKVFFQR